MKVSVPKEQAQGERRVALVPEAVQRLAKGGIDVVVESGAGAQAGQTDAAYEEAGATLGDGFGGDVVAKVAPPSAEEIGRLGRGSVLIGFLNPLGGDSAVRALADAGVTSFAMEAIPRITRAQSMDALSSQATVAGYRAALIAAQELPRFFPMLTTAAGTVRPAKVLVLGAGVAGLQAIATARRLGAVVQAFDVRSAVKEQIESLGARFVELDMGLEDAEAAGGYARALTEEEQQRQRELLADVIGQMDAVISTAAVPGRRAPAARDRAGREEHEAGLGGGGPGRRDGRQLRAHRAGADRGEGGRDDRRPARPGLDDARPRLEPLRAQRDLAARADGQGGRADARLRGRRDRGGLHHPRRRDRARGREEGDGGGLMDLITELTILVLAGFVGLEVISKVPNTLHTPLMSATNAIHGIVLLGGLLLIGEADGAFNKLLCVIAIAFGTINVVGGFLVTDRMLEMFKRRPEPKKDPRS